mmetsp:Transcript_4586/g.13863  ORF Transcript_4586/g.13863 Transcript_4586/m.13863 type:complete len:187 (-) Transcript_4586:1601-2161(-)
MDEEVECEDGSRVKLLTSKLVVQPSSVAERYFKRHYWKSEAGDEDICVMRHSNGLCVIALSERHAVVAGNDEILRIELRPDVQAPRGKRRRDGTFAQEGTILCTITTSSKQYKVRAVIRGVLLELNAAISQDPSLVRRKVSFCYLWSSLRSGGSENSGERAHGSPVRCQRACLHAHTHVPCFCRLD